MLGAVATVGLVALSVATATFTITTSVGDLILGEVTDTGEFLKGLFWAALEGGIGGLIGGKIPIPKSLNKLLDTIDKLSDTVDNISLVLDFMANPEETLKALAEGKIIDALNNKASKKFLSATKPNKRKNKKPNKDKKPSGKCCDGVNEPVDAVTGSFYIEQCDLIINDILEDIAVERFYQSIDKRVSLVGKGWNLSIFSNLEFETGYITLNTFENKKEIFTINENNEIKSLRGGEEIYSLTKLEDGYKVYNTLKKQTLLYNENGILKRIDFPSGQYFDIDIENNKIRKITDNIGHQIKYEYEGDYLLSVEIPNGGTERY